MTRVTLYQANDGVMYETEKEADHADRRMSLRSWLDDADTNWGHVDISKLLDEVLDWADAHYTSEEE